MNTDFPSAKVQRGRGSLWSRWTWLALATDTTSLALLAGAAPAQAAPKKTLVIGMDIGDGRNYDSARQADLSPPLTLGAVYETLVRW